jgi:hypothetical protein
MSIEIECVGTDRHEEWDSALEHSPHATVFHRCAALEQLAADSGTELHPLMGFKGQEPIGVLPIFELRKGPFSAVFSPPPNLWIPRLGPAFVVRGDPKQRKRERRRQGFIDAAFEYIEDTIDPKYLRVRTPTELDDVRQFKWNDCTVRPEYTYVTDLSGGKDAVRNRFTSEARRRLRIGQESESEYTISEEGLDATETVMHHVESRYNEQGEPFPVPTGFPGRLYEALQPGQIRPYVLRVDGDVVGGHIYYDDGDTISGWLGNVKPPDHVDLPVNELLIWRGITDAIERGRTAYELVGAGDPRLNRYKLHFGPELTGFYSMERSGAGIDSLLQLYRWFAQYS